MRAKVAISLLTVACCMLLVGACIDGTTPNCDAGSGCEPGEGSAPLPDTGTPPDSGDGGGVKDSSPDTAVTDAPPG